MNEIYVNKKREQIIYTGFNDLADKPIYVKRIANALIISGKKFRAKHLEFSSLQDKTFYDYLKTLGLEIISFVFIDGAYYQIFY